MSKRVDISFLVFLFALAIQSVPWSAQADESVDLKAAVPALPAVANGGLEAGEAGGQPEGWRFASREEGTAALTDKNPHQGKLACRVECQQAGSFTNLLQSLGAKPYLGKRVRLRASIRSEVEGDQNRVQMWMRIDKQRGDGGLPSGTTFFDNMGDRPIVSDQWKHYDIVGDVKEESDRIVLGCFLIGKGRFWIDDVSLEVVDQHTKITGGFENRLNARQRRHHSHPSRPGTYHITGSMEVIFQKQAADNTTATLLMPLPLSYRDQVPISYELKVDPEAAIESVSIFHDQLENYVARIVVKRLKNLDKIQVRFESTVLVGPSRFEIPEHEIRLPETWPEEARPWLTSTWCVDADHQRIEAIGEKIVSQSDNVLEIIQLVQQKAGKIFRSSVGRVQNLTAVEALDKRGSCTSCANLVAALLRSCGVPARVLSGYPSWSGPLQTHYIVEAYVPGFGWYPIESTRLQSPWPNSGQVNVSIVPIEYESKQLAGRRIQNAGGVPYLSLTERQGRHFYTRGNIAGARHCDHECKLAGEIAAEPETWAEVIRESKVKWRRWLESQKNPVKKNLQFGESGKGVRDT